MPGSPILWKSEFLSVDVLANPLNAVGSDPGSRNKPSGEEQSPNFSREGAARNRMDHEALPACDE